MALPITISYSTGFVRGGSGKLSRYRYTNLLASMSLVAGWRSADLNFPVHGVVQKETDTCKDILGHWPMDRKYDAGLYDHCEGRGAALLSPDTSSVAGIQQTNNNTT
jgi:hypothetical protein